MTDSLSLSLWAVNMAEVPSDRHAWLQRVEAALLEAKAAGSSLLVMPEYVSEIWLPYCEPEANVNVEVATMAKEGAAQLPLLQELVDKTGIALLAGTWPAAVEEGYLNRAHFLVPGRKDPIIHDKLALLRSEKDPEGWFLGVGHEVRPFTWNGLTCAMLICLDVELPAVSARLAREVPDLDLLLVPSYTSFLSGYSRVFGCAKARAVELFTCVAAVGCVGTTPLDPPRDNTSGAAVFLPCEPELGFDGRFADTGVFKETEGAGPLLHVRDIPIKEIRRLRREGAEVWPGAWSDEQLTVTPKQS
ncbi:MAG: nitrilase-related carbon-nitrogen hydrolase [Limibacillus sp.]